MPDDLDPSVGLGFDDIDLDALDPEDAPLPDGTGDAAPPAPPQAAQPAPAEPTAPAEPPAPAPAPAPTPYVPVLQQPQDYSQYLTEELGSLEGARMATVVDALVQQRVNQALANYAELTAAMESDPDEAAAKRLMHRTLAANPTAAQQDPNFATRARMLATLSNAQDPIAAARKMLEKYGGGAPTTPTTPVTPATTPATPAQAPAAGVPAGERAPASVGARQPAASRSRTPEDYMAESLGLPNDYVKRLTLR